MELADLLSEFESLGDNCEFGIIHRAANAKGRGLFQWAGMPLANLIPALYTRFKGLDDPANFKIIFHGDEYMIYLDGFNFRVHTGSYRSTNTEENVVKEAAARMRFLIRKLIQDLEEGTKIFVFRQNEPLDLPTLRELRNALDCYGRNTLLWVVEDSSVPDGTIAWLDDGLMKGSVSRLSSRAAVGATWPHGWHKVLWNAHAERAFGGDATYLPRTLKPFGVGSPAIQLSFLAERPPEVELSYGWGAVEKHQTWAGPECAMSINVDMPKSGLLIRVEGSPFDNQTGRGPRMIITANGVQLKKYGTIPRFCFQFVIPKSLTSSGRPLELKFQFPDAGTPASIGVGTSTRVLGYALRSIAVIATDD